MSTHVELETPLFDTAPPLKREPPKQRVKKPQLTNGSRTCECSQCGRFFGSPNPFDKHLIASAVCRTEEGMRKVGLWQNEYGLWLSGKPNK